MSPEDKQLLRAQLITYLHLQPAHDLGLCYWLARRLGREAETLAYRDPYQWVRDRMDGQGINGMYLSRKSGFTAERELFAQRWVRDLNKELNVSV